MRTQHLLMSLAIVGLAFSTPAEAQRADRGPGGLRGGAGQNDGPRGRGRGGPMRWISQRLQQELELSADQQVQYDELVAQYREQMRGDGREQWRQWRQEMRAAREAGDEARITELREQRRATFAQHHEMMNHFFDDVATFVDGAQLEALNSFRTRVEERISQRREEMQMRRLLRSLPDQLDMTDEQRQLYEGMIDERRAEMRSARESMQPLIEELREARQNGDDARAQEIIAQLRANRPERPDPGALLDTVREMLTDSQRAQLDELVAQVRGAGAAEEQAVDVRVVMRAVKQLRLSNAQEAQVREILRDARRVNAGANRAERAAIGTVVKDEILKVLDTEQATEFRRLMENDGRRERGQRDRAERRERSPRQATVEGKDPV